jgi:hypothetical protein
MEACQLLWSDRNRAVFWIMLLAEPEKGKRRLGIAEDPAKTQLIRVDSAIA